MKQSVWTKEDFLRQVSKEQGKSLIVYEGNVCDITSFKHPGGGNILSPLVGSDATELIYCAHDCDSKVSNILRALAIGKLEDADALLNEEDKDLRKLSWQVEAKFTIRDSKEVCIRLLEPLIVAIVGVATMSLGFSYLGMIALTLAHLRLFWWLHDGGHHSFFENGKQMTNALDVIGMLFFGCCHTGREFRLHAIHHCFVNCMDLDWTNLDSFVLTPEDQMKPMDWQWNGWLQLFMFLIGTSTFWFQKSFATIRIIFLDRNGVKFRLALALALRYYAFWWLGWKSLVPVAFACAAAAFISCLNHIHMDKYSGPFDSQRPLSHLRRQTESTQSISSGWLWTWISGSLDYHVEHHLFPTMASHVLPCLTDKVQELMAKHGVHYNKVPLLTAIQLVFHQLLDPTRDTTSFSKQNRGTVLQRVQISFDLYRWFTVCFDFVFAGYLLYIYSHLVIRLDRHPVVTSFATVFALFLSLVARDGLMMMAFSEFIPEATLIRQPRLSDLRSFCKVYVITASMISVLVILGSMQLTCGGLDSCLKSIVFDYYCLVLLDRLLFDTFLSKVDGSKEKTPPVHVSEKRVLECMATTTQVLDVFQTNTIIRNSIAPVLFVCIKQALGMPPIVNAASVFFLLSRGILAYSCNPHAVFYVL